MSVLVVAWFIIILALVFDYVNGFHDAANSIATVVSTRVLSPKWAVVWAAFFNFIAFLFFSLGVAATIGKGVVDPARVTMAVVAAGLVGAIVWDLVTWYYGIPSSSSHALVGGYAGAALAMGGWDMLVADGILKIGLFILVAPLLGLVVGYVFMVIVYWLFRRASPSRVGGVFRKLQLVSAAAYSLGHGGNDAQKTMGIILAVLLAANKVSEGTFDLGLSWDIHGWFVQQANALGANLAVPAHSDVPLWVVLACHAAMGLGTLSGGWRIVKTMGQKICELQPVHGFCAETAGALTLFGATELRIPVSTTHTITGAIVGVGATRGLHAVKWGVAARVVWAWVLTIPLSALVAALTYYPLAVIIRF